MKARVKATNVIVEVKVYKREHRLYIRTHGEKTGEIYRAKDLDFNIEDGNTSDYWTRLEHQYAGMAMQEILRGCGDYYELTKLASCAHEHRAESIAEVSRIYAHALVEKHKKQENNG